MPRSRIFMLMLAALLIAQSVLGMTVHRCHGKTDTMAHNVVMTDDGNRPHCHSDAAATTKHPGVDHASTPQGICTCAIAHCAPALVSHFDFTPTPVHPPTTPLYHFAVANAPSESLLRPPRSLS